MTYAERLAELARVAGYSAPRRLTDHAVQRMIQRHRPGASWRDAAAELGALLARAEIVDLDGRARVSFWMVAGIRLTVGKDGTVITVLPPGSGRRRDG